MQGIERGARRGKDPLSTLGGWKSEGEVTHIRTLLSIVVRFEIEYILWWG